ncbi:hypothetical protein ABKW28_22480 [Nocardioides sp. 31GB23]|uniref:hypothetical protein n=1 Tax=Nocardioides sp. 31GB23 TaxID=3156065 RepID=UPI0032AF1179
MSSVRAHFEERAAALSDRVSVDCVEKDGAATIHLRPQAAKAVGVILYLYADQVGTVALDDPACVPAELGDDPVADAEAVDHFISMAVEGRATAYHLGRGGCIEVRDDGKSSRSWNNAWPWPGWKGRADRVDYEPYS